MMSLTAVAPWSISCDSDDLALVKSSINNLTEVSQRWNRGSKMSDAEYWSADNAAESLREHLNSPSWLQFIEPALERDHTLGGLDSIFVFVNKKPPSSAPSFWKGKRIIYWIMWENKYPDGPIVETK
jgi:hypothetical protein